ncbi:tetratricopeptide repeat protein [Catenovulum sediminis]|uniref:Tetratricopeptide repeat protein n=2 Tax=Catenovulum sediminis TaxID=1740262 RepID=A0ABV1RL58_9ALTE
MKICFKSRLFFVVFCLLLSACAQQINAPASLPDSQQNIPKKAGDKAINNDVTQNSKTDIEDKAHTTENADKTEKADKTDNADITTNAVIEDNAESPEQLDPAAKPLASKLLAAKPLFSTTIEKNYQLALDSFKKGQLAESEKMFLKLITQQPELAGGYINLALIAVKQNNVKQALWYLEQLLNKNPNQVTALNLQGQIARKNGQFALAETSYQRALQIEPDNSNIHLNYAILLDLNRGQWALAKQHYQLYLTANPDARQVKMWLAIVEQKQKKKQKQNQAAQQEAKQ